MDPRLYIYELRKPRVNNPTFNSSLINNTCFSIYSGGPISHNQSTNNNPNNQYTQRTQVQQYDNWKQQKDELGHNKGSSHLSNIGSSLMKLQDKDIYNKQTSKFDIISMQPIQHKETIKKYPKFTLQDKDAYYFKRMTKAQLPEKPPVNNTARYQQTAGKHIYDVDKNKLQLNMWQSYSGLPNKNQHFTPGMLNHVDEFRSLM